MPTLIDIPTFSDSRGSLSAVDRELPFPVRRAYYIYGTSPGACRAGHRHKANRQFLVCLSGSCVVFVNDGDGKHSYELDSPRSGLIIEADDWHLIHRFRDDTVLLVLASEPYDPADYIDEPYP